jgi:hypothetical protein
MSKKLDVEHLASDHFTIMVVEGHIDINQAASVLAPVEY